VSRTTAPTRWSDDRLVPAGRPFVVHTDDGAALVGTACGPTDGRPIVLSHCWTGGREVWARVAHRLVADGHRVVLYDQRGHGSSSLGTDGCTLAALGRDLRAVLIGLDLHDVVLAGHSMGGMTIQAFVGAELPLAHERVAGVAMVATSCGGLGRGRVLNDATARVVGAARVERLLRGRAGHRFVRGVVGRRPVRADLELTRDLFVACPPAVRSAFARAFLTMDHTTTLTRFERPVAVLAGSSDRLTPLRHAHAMVDAWPTATLQVLLDRGHMLPLEAPDEVAAAIAALS